MLKGIKERGKISLQSKIVMVGSIQRRQKRLTLNFYYSLVFSSEHNILQIQCTNTGQPFAVNTKIIAKSLAATGKNKSIGPDVSDEILKLGGEP
jgi:hypothetical protein